jgi:FkbM family methyltransferase
MKIEARGLKRPPLVSAGGAGGAGGVGVSRVACRVLIMRLRLLVLLSVLVACHGNGGEQGEAAVRAWLKAVRDAQPSQVAHVVDVGANNGAWTRRIMNRVREQGTGMRVQPILFEPQKEYAASLQQLADDWGGRFYPAVAWTKGTNLSFYLSNFKEASSLSEQIALTFSKPEVNSHARRITVPAVDLARVLRACAWRSKGGPLIVKIDTEAAEYDLLPRLLTTGVLCRCTFLLIEWHLNALPPERKLQGVMMRNALEDLLARGCLRPPRLVIHDEDFLNNFGEPIPELGQLAARHAVSRHLPNRRPYAIASSAIAGRSRRQREN